MIDEKQLGWMSGVLDMHGRITRKNNKSRVTPQLVMYVETKNLQVVRRLCEMTGISYETHESSFGKSELQKQWMRRGCSEHCPDAHIHAEAPFASMPKTGRWSITGAGLGVILWNISDRLITSDVAWKWAMEACLSIAKVNGRGSGAVTASVRRLVMLGWAIPPELAGALSDDEEEIA